MGISAKTMNYSLVSNHIDIIVIIQGITPLKGDQCKQVDPAPRQKYAPCISVHIIHCMCIRTLGLGSVKVNVANICRCTT